MAIRPVDIRRKEFKSGFRGYDANQVDDFLDEVADEFERTFAENQRLSEEITSLQERTQQFEDLETSIREALVHAQQVARDLRQNAGKEAELIVREANEQAHRILAESSGRLERIQESYEVLHKAKQDFASDFRHLLKSYLAVMDNADVASAREIEASLRERLDLESVGAAREAAETRRQEGRDDTAAHEQPLRDTDETRGTEETRRTGDVESTQQLQVTSSPSGEGTSAVGDRGGAEPEVEEPEVEPSSTRQDPAFRRSGSAEADTMSQRPDREFERAEQSAPAEENRAADEFFGQEGQGDENEERKIFRASRFLRRRN
ncbi:MAG: Cell division initiation protein DivIVA [uncultured Rubrobacteraceae bacterium]|uniref:Cell wall synthesis protein Wag31 n=1 Tax=uncultured Rubrobacteraceae bacterium TaxID=349277 RepID=A0A6J4QBM5_9ACTN|nr:MAG: Cell division initiation protein DivIVA [uncultured Rubrobacteraceae bacterium]